MSRFLKEPTQKIPKYTQEGFFKKKLDFRDLRQSDCILQREL